MPPLCFSLSLLLLAEESSYSLLIESWSQVAQWSSALSTSPLWSAIRRHSLVIGRLAQRSPGPCSSLRQVRAAIEQQQGHWPGKWTNTMLRWLSLFAVCHCVECHICLPIVCLLIINEVLSEQQRKYVSLTVWFPWRKWNVAEVCRSNCRARLMSKV